MVSGIVFEFYPFGTLACVCIPFVYNVILAYTETIRRVYLVN